MNADLSHRPTMRRFQRSEDGLEAAYFVGTEQEIPAKLEALLDEDSEDDDSAIDENLEPIPDDEVDMRASKYEVLMEELPNGAQVWLTAEEEEITPRQEAKFVDDGKGWGQMFLQAVHEAVGEYGRWGWCTLKTTYLKDGREGTAYLGCCSYAGPQAWRNGGYYEQKVKEAQADWARHTRLANHIL